MLDNCTTEWTTLNGVNGRKFTGPNGNSIFLPAAGYRWIGDLNYAGSWGFYWSSTLYGSGSYDAYGLSFYSSYANWVNYNRRRGHNVRPVR